MEVWGWSHSPESVGRELGSSAIMLLPPFPGRKRKRNPSLQPQAQPETCTHPLISCSQIRMGFAEVLGTVVVGGLRGERALMVRGLKRETEREGGRVYVCMCVCVCVCARWGVSKASG